MKTSARSSMLAAFLFFVGLAVAPSATHAQYVTFFGGNYAHDCYQIATFSVRMEEATRHDLDECNLAISQGQLSRRDLVATYINRGIIHVKIGDISKAEQDYLKALDMSDRTPETFINLGNLQYLMQNYHRAIDDYDHAESLGLGQNDILHLNRGMALSRLGSLEEAEAEYIRALEIRPNWLLAIDKLEILREKRRELAEQAAQ